MLLLSITYHNELINDLELPKFNKTLDNLLNSIHPSGIDLERLAIKEVTNHQDHIQLQGILVAIGLAIVFLVFSIIKDKFRIFPLQKMLKDAAIFIPFLLVVLSLNYVVSAKFKERFNVYGVLYYVDLDKLIMQALIVAVIWCCIGILFGFVWTYQAQEYYEYETQDVQDLHRIYENLYLYNDPHQESMRLKVQYHSIRQQFIFPNTSVFLQSKTLRSDFNFAKYLETNQLQIYTTLLRVNTFTGIMLIPIVYIGILKIFAPIYLSGILLLFYYIQNRNLIKIYSNILNPYQFKPISRIDRQPFRDQSKFLQFKQYNQSQSNSPDNIIYSTKLNIRIVQHVFYLLQLHFVVFLQTFWFGWLFYAHRYTRTIYDYTGLAIMIAIASINITILIPKCVNCITYTHQHCDVNKVILKSQYQKCLLFERVAHYLRSRDFHLDRPSVDSQDDKFSFTAGQKTLLRYAYISIVQGDSQEAYKQKIIDYRQQLIDNPDLLIPKVDVAQRSEGSESQSESDISSLKMEPPKPITIEEAMKTYEDNLLADMQNVSEGSRIDMMQLVRVAKLVGGNMPIWYHVLLVQKYFKGAQLTDTLTFQDLVNYSGHQQYQVESQEWYEEYDQIIPLKDFKDQFTDFFSELEVEEIIKEQAYQTKLLNLLQFQQYLKDVLVQFPQ